MRFEFENLGPIRKAGLEIGDLTIIAGRNNTGKTYIAYALFGFLNGIDRQFRSEWGRLFVESYFQRKGLGPTIAIVKELLNKGQFGWRMDRETLDQEREHLISEMTKEYSKNGLSRTFRTSPEQFKSSSLRLTEAKPFVMFYSTRGLLGQEGMHIDWNFDKGEVVAKLSGEELSRSKGLPPQHYELSFANSFLHFLINGTFVFLQRPEIFSSSRHSIPLFIHDLDYAKSQAVFSVEYPREDWETDKPARIVASEKLSSYPLPVNENIDSLRRVLLSVDETASNIDGAKANAVEEILGGRYRVTGSSLRFVSMPKNRVDFDIPIHTASSSALELAELNFFLRELHPDDSRLIIIDEPESHLDTANQIQFARLLARLVNGGMMVLITTHSDYIIKEVNNLIMLNEPFADKEETMKQHGYKDNESLDPAVVKAYIAENKALTPCKIDRFGIDMPMFDKTINSINRVSNDLFSRLHSEEEED